MNKQSEKIRLINSEIRNVRKLCNVIYFIENQVWKDRNIGSELLQKHIRQLERRKWYIKRDEDIKAKMIKCPDYKPKMLYNRPSIEEIKAIPIRMILENRGISIGHGNFFKLRNENTASAKFNEELNVFSDFGNGGAGGSNLDLIIALDNVSVGEAIKHLSSTYL